MPRRKNELPLPEGWDVEADYDGKLFFIDHNTKQTTWIDPRDRVTKPATFADCVGDELPYGWDQEYDPKIGTYFVNHLSQITQIEDPRLQWREQQEEMLKEYLAHARDNLAAKHETYTVKRERLAIAQEDLQHHLDTLTQWKASGTSLNSVTSSCSTKYDLDLLKGDVLHGKKRVGRLKQELDQIHTEMVYHEKGLHTLAQVDEKLVESGNMYSREQAQEILSRITNIKRSLCYGEKEKHELMQSLSRLKEEVLMTKGADGSSPDVSTLSIPQERLSTASQTDLCGDYAGSDVRWGEILRMRLQYDEARKHVSHLQQELLRVEDQMVPGQQESDKDRLMLIQEKEQLLRELRGYNPAGRADADAVETQRRVYQLEQDLARAMAVSSQQIADRLRLNESKSQILEKLAEATRLTTYLESQLKSLSVSTLSMSSGSSRGSLGSLSGSSKGSLSSLSYVDIYSQAPPVSDVNLPELHRRVEKILQGHTTNIPTIMEVGDTGDTAEINAESQVSDNTVAPPVMHSTPFMDRLNASASKLSSKSSPSLSSISSPVASTYDVQVFPPPSYEQHLERQFSCTPSNSEVHLEPVTGSYINQLPNTLTGNKILHPTQLPVLPNSVLASNVSGGPISNSSQTLSILHTRKGLEPILHNSHVENQLQPSVETTNHASSGSAYGLVSDADNPPPFVPFSIGPQFINETHPAPAGNHCANHPYVNSAPTQDVYLSSSKPAIQYSNLVPQLHYANQLQQQQQLQSSQHSVYNQIHPPHPHPHELYTNIQVPTHLSPPHPASFGTSVAVASTPSTYHQHHSPGSVPPHLSRSSVAGPPAPLPTMDIMDAGNRGNNNYVAAENAPDTPLNPPLSPISEGSSGVCNHLSGVNTRSVSAAVSDESVAGDSGVFEASGKRSRELDDVFEMRLESAQVQIKLKYEGIEGQLEVGLLQARNLSALGICEQCNLCIKASLLPSSSPVLYCSRLAADTNNPKFCEMFKVEIAENRLPSKTLQIHVWAVWDSQPEECLGSAQVSLAAYEPRRVSVEWYNVLSFQFMKQADMLAPTVNSPETTNVSPPQQRSIIVLPKASPSHHAPPTSSQPSPLAPQPPVAVTIEYPHSEDRVNQLLEASSVRLRRASLGNEERLAQLEVAKDNRHRSSSFDNSYFRGVSAAAAISALKEESSDESTIISSQTSTLTRNQGPEDMEEGAADEDDMREGSGDDEEEDEEFHELLATLQKQLCAAELDGTVGGDRCDSELSQLVQLCDKETNTEVRQSPQRRPPSSNPAVRNSGIRRSKTFSPTVGRPALVEYICKLNRSDSDSSVKYKKNFERNAHERRSIRRKSRPESLPYPPDIQRGVVPGILQTSLDLELDLQASETQLWRLQEEIGRLKDIKQKFEKARATGDSEPAWFANNDVLQRFLVEADKMRARHRRKGQQSKIEERAERRLKKATREIQKLRSHKKQPDEQGFREKMAFFTKLNVGVPLVGDSDSDVDDGTLKAFSSKCSPSKSSSSTPKSPARSPGSPFKCHSILRTPVMPVTRSQSEKRVSTKASVGIGDANADDPASGGKAHHRSLSDHGLVTQTVSKSPTAVESSSTGSRSRSGSLTRCQHPSVQREKLLAGGSTLLQATQEHHV